MEHSLVGGPPLLEAMADDEARFAGVTRLGVDEHVWHHVSERPNGQGGRGSKYLTGMVDLTPRPDGTPQARLLDLVAGRSGRNYRDWLDARGQQFRDGVKEATLDPFHGYKNAIDDQLADAAAVLDAFHVVKLATTAVDECRRRLQQQIHGHRGRKTDPLYRCAQQLRSVYHQTSHAAGRRIALQVLDTFASCPIPEISRLGRTLRQWVKIGTFSGVRPLTPGEVEAYKRGALGVVSRSSEQARMFTTRA